MEVKDVIVVGGGIVGLATAYSLCCRHPRKKIALLEKESEVARHQTGHNSGVLHSGIYYKPGSLKALNCRMGKQAMESFCASQGIPFERCGKVIVAANAQEMTRLQALLDRGRANGVDCEMIGPERLKELEPHANGIKAIHVKETGIVSYRRVCQCLADLLTKAGHSVLTDHKVTGLRETAAHVIVQTLKEEYRARWVVNCAGLHSDLVAALSGVHLQARIIPFRGEYFELKPEAAHLCRSLIYPVPDPRFPFLGVHFTRMIEGGVECGPNAVFAFAREGYRKSDINWKELAACLSYPGFIRMAANYWQMGMGEMWRSLNKSAFVRALQQLVPEIRAEHLVPAPAGVRAQAVDSSGRLLDDFAFTQTARMIHVLNAPSPAATAALSIGQSVADKLNQWLSS